MVGASLKSVLKLFLLERRLIGVMLAGDIDQVFGLITCERRLFSHSAKPATARIDEGNPQFRLQSVRKSRTTLKQAQDVATEHEMEDDYAASAQSALDETWDVRQLCYTAGDEKKCVCAASCEVFCLQDPEHTSGICSAFRSQLVFSFCA